MNSRYQFQVSTNWIFYLPDPLLKTETPNKTTVLTFEYKTNTRYYSITLQFPVLHYFTLINHKSMTNITLTERTSYEIK